jgi:hypothetical protein
LGILFFAGTPLCAQTCNKSTDLKSGPSNDSKIIKNIPAGTALKLSKREGFWVEVETGGAKGWLKLSDVAMGQGTAGGLGALHTGRAGKGNIVSTSAARGLSAKDMVAASPDLKEFESLKNLSVGLQDAERFSKEGGLVVRQIPLLGAGVASAQGKDKKISSNPSAKRKKAGANSRDDDDDDDADN